MQEFTYDKCTHNVVGAFHTKKIGIFRVMLYVYTRIFVYLFTRRCAENIDVPKRSRECRGKTFLKNRQRVQFASYGIILFVDSL